VRPIDSKLGPTPRTHEERKEIARLLDLRNQALANIEAGISPMINTLAVRRIDGILADRSVQVPNGRRRS
jgi:hypothetical protein